MPRKKKTPEAAAASENGAEPVRLRPRRPCPICGKPSAQHYHPFCSSRCADVDLHRWLGGQYRIPTEEPADPGGGGEPPSDDDER